MTPDMFGKCHPYARSNCKIFLERGGKTLKYISDFKVPLKLENWLDIN